MSSEQSPDDCLPFPDFAPTPLPRRPATPPRGSRDSPPRDRRSPPPERPAPPAPAPTARVPSDPKGTLPPARQRELQKVVDDFAAGSQPTLALSSALTGLERKLVHLLAEERGVDTQSFGEGRQRAVHLIRRQEPPAPPAPSPTDPTPSPCSPRISYSAVFIDDEARARLLSALRRYLPPAERGWREHADHMTICMGSLADAQSLDHRGVAEKLREQVRALPVGGHFPLRCVSIGSTPTVVAAGVVGCCSTNRTPHITLAVAPGSRPQDSNKISFWRPLPEEEQVTVTGVVREVPLPGQSRTANNRTRSPPRYDAEPEGLSPREDCGGRDRGRGGGDIFRQFFRPGFGEDDDSAAPRAEQQRRGPLLKFTDPSDGALVSFLTDADGRLRYEVTENAAEGAAGAQPQRRPPIADAVFGEDTDGPYVEFPSIDTALALPPDFKFACVPGSGRDPLFQALVALFDAHGVRHNLPPRSRSPSPPAAAPAAGRGRGYAGRGRGAPAPQPGARAAPL